MQLDGLVNDSTFCWWGEARNEYLGPGGTGPVADPFSFTTIVEVPAAPAVASPSNGYLTNAKSDTLEWSSAARTDEFVIYVDTTSLSVLATERYRPRILPIS